MRVFTFQHLLLVTIINIDELKNRKRDHFVGLMWLVVTRALFGKQFMSVLSKFKVRRV